MSILTKKENPVKWLRIDELDVRWVEAQRGLNEARARKIAEEMDPEKLGVLVVSQENGEGKHHIIDGQHRHRAVQLFAGGSERVPCLILNATDPARAAELYLGMNQNRAPTPAVEDHRISVTAGREKNVAVQEILDRMGYKVSTGSEDGCLAAISACLRIYDRYGGEGLERTLSVIQDTWGYQRDSVQASILKGYADLLATTDGLDADRLVDKVAKKYTPARLLGAAKTAREMFQGSVSGNVTRVLKQRYNHGLREESRI